MVLCLILASSCSNKFSHSLYLFLPFFLRSIRPGVKFTKPLTILLRSSLGCIYMGKVKSKTAYDSVTLPSGCACVGHLGRCNTNRTNPICFFTQNRLSKCRHWANRHPQRWFSWQTWVSYCPRAALVLAALGDATQMEPILFVFITKIG
jgi:hypothetical protein